ERRGQESPGTHRVHEDVLRRERSGEVLRDARQRRLRRRVRDQPWRLPLRRMRRDVDDACPGGLPQEWQRSTDAAHGGHRSDIEVREEVVVGQTEEVPRLRADRVDQGVELTPALADGSEARFDLVRPAEIDGEPEGIRAAGTLEHRDGLVERRLAPRHDADPRSVLGETERGRAADALRTSGDDGGSPLESEIHAYPPLDAARAL